MPFFVLFLSFFSSQQAPGLIQFSFAKLLELLKYDNKNNELLVQRSSLCLTSRDRGKPSPTFTFAIRLPNCFSFKVLHYSALVLSTKTWYLILLSLILPLPVSRSLPLHHSLRQWPSAAAWVLQAEGWCPTDHSAW